MANQFLDLMKKRRTIYALGNKVKQDEKALSELIFTAAEYAPSAFNSQSSRLVILFGEAHAYFWNHIVTGTLKKIVGTGDFSSTAKKMQSFAAGFGTVLFFEDRKDIESLQTNFPLYAEHFPAFSEQSNGMAEFAVWTALATENIGASLQHYNPIIDEETKAHWNLPESWVLRAEMPFGSIEAPAGKKEIRTREGRFLVKNN